MGRWHRFVAGYDLCDAVTFAITALGALMCIEAVF